MNNSKKRNHGKLKQIVSLVICFLMVAAVSMRRDAKFLGHSFDESAKAAQTVGNDTMRVAADGSIVINTKSLGKDITGYGGAVPLEIVIKDGKVADIKALPNAESPDFFNQAKSLFAQWKGKRVEDAAAMKVDAVSGATFSSKAIIANMQRGLAYAAKTTAEKHWYDDIDVSAKAIAGLVVALMAAIVPLFYKNRRYRIVQQVLNVGVLGFWCGSMMSYASLIGFMSNGINVVVYPIATVLLIVAFIYPMFGKKSYYCTHVCPYGSLQELAGRCVGYKIKMKATTIHRLETFRKVLWAVLMLCLWSGVWFGWVDYEPFSAFIVKSAAWVAIVIGAAFILLSTVVMRPYCRFVCPMGTMFKMLN